jgi:hypothetical protein
MRTLGVNKIWTFCHESEGAEEVETSIPVRKAKGHVVKSFFALATRVAELQFRNPDFVLMFRGQSRDHRGKNQLTSLKPSLSRPEPPKKEPPNGALLNKRFQALAKAEQTLLDRYRGQGMLGADELARHRMLRWAILQHYEVCPTPLLDVTHSLRIAASFASEGASDEAFIFVLAIPYLSGAITASAEAGLQIIRLASVCPPTALRPHVQEGYLLGEYPDMSNLDQKELYAHHEIDFGRRLIAKFRLNPETFWKSDTFPRVARKALYPPEIRDPLFELTQQVKDQLDR